MCAPLWDRWGVDVGVDGLWWLMGLDVSFDALLRVEGKWVCGGDDALRRQRG